MKSKYTIKDEFEVKIFNKITGEVVYEGRSIVSNVSNEGVTLEIDSILNVEISDIQ